MKAAVLPAAAARFVPWLIHATARFTRPLTMGVRAVLLDEGGRVFLVRHSYVPGWHLPGGAVEPGESVRAALVREVREETGLVVEGEPALHGLFLNRRRDHVAVYVVRDARGTGPRAADWEIVEGRFVPPDALPEGTTPATRRRLAEVLDGAERADLW